MNDFFNETMNHLQSNLQASEKQPGLPFRSVTQSPPQIQGTPKPLLAVSIKNANPIANKSVTRITEITLQLEVHADHRTTHKLSDLLPLMDAIEDTMGELPAALQKNLPQQQATGFHQIEWSARLGQPQDHPRRQPPSRPHLVGLARGHVTTSTTMNREQKLTTKIERKESMHVLDVGRPEDRAPGKNAPLHHRRNP